MRRCREATTKDPKAKHYIDVLMSSVEYETFVKLMRMMRPLAAMRLAERAESKNEDFAPHPSHGSKASSASDHRHHSESKTADSKSDSKGYDDASK